MFRGRDRRFTSAHAIAIAALFFALGGGAYAAVQSLPPNSVGTRQLQNRSVTPAKLSRRTIRQLQKIARKFNPRTVPGPAGPSGERGEQGAAGPSDLYLSASGAGVLAPDHATSLASISLPAGQYLIQAKTNLSNGTGQVLCYLAADPAASGPDEWDGGVVTLPSAGGGTRFFLSGVATFASTTPANLFCAGPEGVDYDSARIWAIGVGSLHGP
jgi:hypothetical protein